INTIEDIANTKNNNNNSNNTKTVTGQQTTNVSKNAQPIQDQLKMEKQINELEDLQEQNLQKALDDSKSCFYNCALFLHVLCIHFSSLFEIVSKKEKEF
ncbi:MAG: hypothetical protein EBS86_15520, partial [Crocinitomicaceae bacterium]|nr:hypothetical protein [Crocinitomicaceae bacterium]